MYRSQAILQCGPSMNPHQQTCQVSKNDMYLASLQLLEQTTKEGAEDYAPTNKSPTCPYGLNVLTIMWCPCRPASSKSQSVASVPCCHTSKLSQTDDLSYSVFQLETACPTSRLWDTLYDSKTHCLILRQAVWV